MRQSRQPLCYIYSLELFKVTELLLSYLPIGELQFLHAPLHRAHAREAEFRFYHLEKPIKSYFKQTAKERTP